MQTNVIQNVGQLAVPVHNIKRSITFYEEILGLNLLFQTDTMAFFDCNGLRIMLTLPEKEEFAHSSSVIYFNVADIKQAYSTLQEKEVTFIDSPHIVAKMGNTETWMVFFKDSEGNTHGLMSEVDVL
ncbi:glyoxalase [Fictibacillus phosphorivorans]|uniref:Glyoxalase n=1 Tax=Fictibacillus phosphorivorans TaxID=1221500 RepID=A0A165N2W3_9BACL|nr:VOC family protein [Fictibacillus phosphorivorans]KZE64394.1 glyoxalase [Fictibacillus phosphorivorans]